MESVNIQEIMQTIQENTRGKADPEFFPIKRESDPWPKTLDQLVDLPPLFDEPAPIGGVKSRIKAFIKRIIWRLSSDVTGRQKRFNQEAALEIAVLKQQVEQLYRENHKLSAQLRRLSQKGEKEE